MKGIVVPVLLFLCVTYGFRLLVDATVRVLALRAGTSDNAVALMVQEAREGRWLGALHAALNLIGLGVPATMMARPEVNDLDWPTLGALILGLGVANLVYALIARFYVKDKE